MLTAAALRDCRVQSAYPDGIFWHKVGRRAKATDAALGVARLLVAAWLSDEEARQAEAKLKTADKAEMKRMIQELLGGQSVGGQGLGRRCLVVLDDVWEDTAIRSVLAARTAQCGVVLTTRQGDELHHIGVGATVRVDVLPMDTAVALLWEWAGGVEVGAAPGVESRGGESGAGDDGNAAVKKLAKMCGCLPFALSAAGAHVALLGSWHKAIEAIERRRAQGLKNSTAFSAEYPDVHAVLQASLDALPRGVRNAVLCLGALPPGSSAVPLPEGVVEGLVETAGAEGTVTGVAKGEVVARLKARSMVRAEPTPWWLGAEPVLNLHDLQRAFLRARAEQPPSAAELLAGAGLDEALAARAVEGLGVETAQELVEMKEVPEYGAKGMAADIAGLKPAERRRVQKALEGIVRAEPPLRQHAVRLARVMLGHASAQMKVMGVRVLVAAGVGVNEAAKVARSAKGLDEKQFRDVFVFLLLAINDKNDALQRCGWRGWCWGTRQHT